MATTETTYELWYRSTHLGETMAITSKIWEEKDLVAIPDKKAPTKGKETGTRNNAFMAGYHRMAERCFTEMNGFDPVYRTTSGTIIVQELEYDRI